MPSLYNDFLESLRFFSVKLGFNDWKSILAIIQVISAISVIILSVILVLGTLLYVFYWRRQRDAPDLNEIRKDWVQSKNPSYLILSSTIYLNIWGYYSVFEMEVASYHLPLIISSIVLMMFLLGLFGKYIIQNYE